MDLLAVLMGSATAATYLTIIGAAVKHYRVESKKKGRDSRSHLSLYRV
jgi:hypothetical protein